MCKNCYICISLKMYFASVKIKIKIIIHVINVRKVHVRKDPDIM